LAEALQLAQRSPSPPYPAIHGLWSLWDMLETWGYRYLQIGLSSAYAETSLIGEVSRPIAGVGVAAPATIDSNSPVMIGLLARCDEILKFCDGEDLGAIPGNTAAIQARIHEARRPGGRPLLARDLLDGVTHIKNDFAYILHNRQFTVTSDSAMALATR
jgi:hypothetical protein